MDIYFKTIIYKKSTKLCAFFKTVYTNIFVFTFHLRGHTNELTQVGYQLYHTGYCLKHFKLVIYQEWREVAPLLTARTGHSMALLDGVPHVIGGFSNTEFFSNLEQLVELPNFSQWKTANQVKGNIRTPCGLPQLRHFAGEKQFCSNCEQVVSIYKVRKPGMAKLGQGVEAVLP